MMIMIIMIIMIIIIIIIIFIIFIIIDDQLCHLSFSSKAFNSATNSTEQISHLLLGPFLFFF